jgi:hypothetical protein
VSINDGAIVQGSIYTGAGGGTTLGSLDTIANIYSQSPVSIGSGNTIAILDSTGAVTEGLGNTIGSTSTTVPPFPTFPSIAPTFPSGTGVFVAAGQTFPLAPGAYGGVVVPSTATLQLSAGEYDFQALTLSQGGTITVPSANETVKIYVRDTVLYEGSITSGGSAAPVFLGYTGGAPINVDVPFFGTIVAPNAGVTLHPVTGSHKGEFFARNLLVIAHGALDPGVPDVVSDPLSCVVH